MSLSVSTAVPVDDDVYQGGKYLASDEEGSSRICFTPAVALAVMRNGIPCSSFKQMSPSVSAAIKSQTVGCTLYTVYRFLIFLHPRTVLTLLNTWMIPP